LGKINIDRIRELASEIRKALAELGEIALLPEEAFLRDSRCINSAKYLLIVATEGAIDICNHIAAKRGGRCPEDYGDCFMVLEEMGILDAAIAERLMRMAKFRNLLVHLYWKVDNSRVYKIIKDDINDIDAYLKAVSGYVAEYI
jgi:uncharacterized protein YutE (UPF0331/DUF86 family)